MITPLPTPPSTADSANFNSRANAFLGALPVFATEANSIVGEVNGLITGLADNAGAAAASASLASSAAAMASASAAYKGLWTALTGALSMPASTYHSGFFWVLNSSAANVTTEVPGVSSKWTKLNMATTDGVETLTNKTITGLKETKVAVAASNISLTTGNYFSKTIIANTTFTVSGTPASGTTASFILELTNGGAFTVDWFSGMTWAGGIAPSLTLSGIDILGFYTHDGGTVWRGLVLANDIKAAA